MNDLVEQIRALVVDGVPAAEQAMLQLPQVECPVVHHFGPGTYMREVSIPAGTFAIGHHQKFEHMNIVLAGAVLVYDQDTGTVREVRAPAMYVGKPGRKLGYVLEDLVWLNVYATPLRDVTALEDLLLDKTTTYVQSELSRTELHAAVHARDREDYAALLEHLGITDAIVWAQTEDPSDQVPMPAGSWKFRVGPSGIHGQGVICASPVEAGEIIGPAKLAGMRTPLGRYTNHSPNPNCVMRFTADGDVYLVARRRLHGNLGGLPGEEATIDYWQALKDLGAFI